MKSSPLLSGSHDASASLTGYLFQARYALLRGLEEGRRHPGHALSIEKFDDVAFEEAGRPVELIQPNITEIAAMYRMLASIFGRRSISGSNGLSKIPQVRPARVLFC